jgi:D-alanyl-lipoteichoic acid acyltransferase DltB (MBOAT superfamily)
MLFNSFEFIFHFFPVVFGGLALLYTTGRKNLVPGWLIASSIYYYGDFRLWHIFVLAFELLLNYYLAERIWSSSKRLRWLWLGIAIDVAVLAWFKYAHLLHHLHMDEALLPDTLPLGISFYTFQLIAYLVDLYAKRIERASVRDYLFFILFFPQLIAGPIVHYMQIAPQVKALEFGKCCRYLPMGVAFFSVGLVKKVFLADTFATFADKSFGAVASGAHLGMVEAWGGVLSYSMQIYFDFCAYSEMAIGLGLIFGIRLPVNFLSPYKAESFRDFWRRWHITLSAFLRDYLYIPLGGNRRGRFRTLANIVFVMTLAGAWHGSGWNFVLWGAGHGILIALNHLLLRIKLFSSALLRPLKIALTFISVTLLWVLFRSESLKSALSYYRELLTISALQVDWQIDWSKIALHWDRAMWLWIALALVLVWFAPNLKKVLRYEERPERAIANPGFLFGLFAGMLFLISMKMMSGSASKAFLYFMF